MLPLVPVVSVEAICRPALLFEVGVFLSFARTLTVVPWSSSVVPWSAFATGNPEMGGSPTRNSRRLQLVRLLTQRSSPPRFAAQNRRQTFVDGSVTGVSFGWLRGAHWESESTYRIRPA